MSRFSIILITTWCAMPAFSQCAMPMPFGMTGCPKGPPQDGRGPPQGGRGPPRGGRGPPQGGRGPTNKFGNSGGSVPKFGGKETSCSTTVQFTGLPEYDTSNGTKALAAPLRGIIGCVDIEVLKKRPTATVGGSQQAANNIYGPFEAGFSSKQPGTQCMDSETVPGGVDTLAADLAIKYICDKNKKEGKTTYSFTKSILDSCGGHAIPYHYHQDMSCLYTSSNVKGLEGHSTRIGTALDGNGIYGKYIEGGKIPSDLDACGGRHGVTPDSGGKVVYYYVMQDSAPFTVGCFGPVQSIDECRSLYKECSDNNYSEITTSYGKDKYNNDCPCFDSNGSNVPGATGPPNFLGQEHTINGDTKGNLRG